MIEALTRWFHKARTENKDNQVAIPSVPVDAMKCKQCHWIMDAYGGHMEKYCDVHQKIHDLSESLMLEREAKESLYDTLKDLHKVLNIPDEDDPVLVAKMRMEDIAEAEIVREGRDFWYERYECLRDVFSNPDKLPQPHILEILNDFCQWPDDSDAGKRLQREVGLKAIPPKSEYECGAGVWVRLTSHLKRSDEAQRWKAEFEKSNAENDALRSIASTILPCHYCGVDDLAKCPHGFPGCSLADDAFCGEHSYSMEIQKLRDKVKALEGSGGADHILTRGALNQLWRLLKVENQTGAVIKIDKLNNDLEKAIDLIRLLDRELESLGVNSLAEVTDFLNTRAYYEDMKHDQVFGESPFKPGLRVQHVDGRNGLVVGRKGSTVMWKPDNQSRITIQSDFRNLRLLPLE